MEENTLKKHSWASKILFVLFMIFICLYAVGLNGYVSKRNEDKTLYTEEQIKKFESDVLEGREIDVNKYIETSKIDYSNKVSDFGEKVSNMVVFVFNKCFDAISHWFEYLLS